LSAGGGLGAVCAVLGFRSGNRDGLGVVGAVMVDAAGAGRRGVVVVGFGVGLLGSRAAGTAATTAHSTHTHRSTAQRELTQASVALPKWVHLPVLAWLGGCVGLDFRAESALALSGLVGRHWLAPTMESTFSSHHNPHHPSIQHLDLDAHCLPLVLPTAPLILYRHVGRHDE